MGNWRDSYRTPRFFALDARVLYVVLPALFHVRWWTATAALAAIAFLWWIERRYGMSFESGLRMLRRGLIGPVRPALAPKRRRPLVDFG